MYKDNYKNLLFTGGHHNSAVAVIDYIQSNFPHIKIFWVGKKYIPHTKKLLPEYNEVTKRGVEYHKINTGKVFRTTSIKYIPQVVYNLLLIPFGFLQAFFILSKIKPDVIVSFGGYIAVPIVVVGKVFYRISVISHEQTAVLGLANKTTAKYSEKICVSWPIENYVVSDDIKKKMIYTGLPVRKVILDLVNNNAEFIKLFDNSNRTLYVTGGKSGAQFLNKLVYESFDEIIKDFNLIWQCGPSKVEYGFNFIKEFLNNKPENVREHVILQEYFNEDEIGNVFYTSDIVLSRGGAHTTYELVLMQKPSILIPIPWASNNEQYKNAEIVKNIGLAEILDQNSTNTEEFINILFKMKENIDKYKVVNDIKLPLDGQKRVAKEIIKLL